MIPKHKQVRLKGKAMQELVKAVYERDQHKCVNCGKWVDEGVKPHHAYPGSSTFDTAEMARLIDYIVSECKDYGIETRPKEEIDSLLAEWSDRKCQTGAKEL